MIRSNEILPPVGWKMLAIMEGVFDIYTTFSCKKILRYCNAGSNALGIYDAILH
jgi:hypothetical protein